VLVAVAAVVEVYLTTESTAVQVIHLQQVLYKVLAEDVVAAQLH
jgi:hypothetical protein